jgi:hypothetical protein
MLGYAAFYPGWFGRTDFMAWPGSEVDQQERGSKTLVGHDILVGRTLQRTTTADDYANFILACLTHDIGYVRGIVQGDGDDAYVADLKGRKVQLPVGSSDAALAPYHIDRSKLFVIERPDAVEEVDAARIARAIEYADRTASARPN